MGTLLSTSNWNTQKLISCSRKKWLLSLQWLSDSNSCTCFIKTRAGWHRFVTRLPSLMGDTVTLNSLLFAKYIEILRWKGYKISSIICCHSVPSLLLSLPQKDISDFFLLWALFYFFNFQTAELDKGLEGLIYEGRLKTLDMYSLVKWWTW